MLNNYITLFRYFMLNIQYSLDQNIVFQFDLVPPGLTVGGRGFWVTGCRQPRRESAVRVSCPQPVFLIFAAQTHELVERPQLFWPTDVRPVHGRHICGVVRNRRRRPRRRWRRRLLSGTGLSRRVSRALHQAFQPDANVVQRQSFLRQEPFPYVLPSSGLFVLRIDHRRRRLSLDRTVRNTTRCHLSYGHEGSKELLCEMFVLKFKTYLYVANKRVSLRKQFVLRFSLTQSNVVYNRYCIDYRTNLNRIYRYLMEKELTPSKFV